jgi:Concanavalin A-like lectin/glucanases superfamily
MKNCARCGQPRFGATLAWSLLKAALGFAFVVPGGTARADIHDSLVVHLRFDGDVQDSSGRGNHGTIVRPSADSPYVPGIIGQAYQTKGTVLRPDDSSSSYITLGTPDDLNFDGSCDVSFSWWGLYNAADQHDDIPWLSNKDWLSSTELGWVIASEEGSSGIRVNFRSRYERKIDYRGGSNWGDGQWHHYVVTWSRGDAGVGTVYQDGAQVASVPLSGVSVTLSYPYPATYPTNIFQDGTGAYTDGTGGANWDNALIDDFGIWRRALTDDEISTIYTLGSQGKSALD